MRSNDTIISNYKDMYISIFRLLHNKRSIRYTYEYLKFSIIYLNNLLSFSNADTSVLCTEPKRFVRFKERLTFEPGITLIKIFEILVEKLT